jgi:hypothetical protein
VYGDDESLHILLPLALFNWIVPDHNTHADNNDAWETMTMNPAILAVFVLHPDPVALVWVVIAAGIATLSLVRFSRYFESGMLRTSHFPTWSWRNTQTLWLRAVLTIWWSLDALDQARFYVIETRLRQAASGRVECLHFWAISWSLHLGGQGFVFWSAVTIAIDAWVVVLLIWLYGRAPRWLAAAMAGWGIIRWVLAGAATTWGHVHVFGPGSYLIAACMAYLVIAPAHYRYILTGISLWTLGDAIASSPSHPILVDAVLIAGFAFLTVSGWQATSSRSLRLIAAGLAAEILMLASGHHALRIDSNHLWVVMLFALSWGRHLKSQTTNVFEQLGG